MTKRSSILDSYIVYYTTSVYAPEVATHIMMAPVNHIISPEHEIRNEKCLDTCQHKIKFVLTFAKNNLTLVEICTVALYFGLDICHIKLEFVQESAQKMSNVQLLFHALLVHHTNHYMHNFEHNRMTKASSIMPA